MSDFLIRLDRQYAARPLLELLRQPYGHGAPEGWEFDYSWGAMAILKDEIARGENLRSQNGMTVGWVGDLLLQGGESGLEAVMDRLRCGDISEIESAYRKSGLLDSLNGAYAMVVATDQQVSVITDPMASVQVYLGKDEQGKTLVIGSHPDLVARCLGGEYRIDPVSVCDFINTGTPCCPRTMFQDVTEVEPGRVHSHVFGDGRSVASGEFQYWVPPVEVHDESAQEGMVEEFVRAWGDAVAERSVGECLAVQLSGGLDSRVVLASIPTGRHTYGVTLCDEINREARVAREVARRYRCEWVPLRRQPEYLAETLLPATRFTGCEGEWHHGHTIGFAKQLRELGVHDVFTGLLMDNNLKGYYAEDLVRVGRGGGLLPAEYRTVLLDYASQVSSFCHEHIRPELVTATIDRRRQFAKNHLANGRQSRFEWLDGYPYSQSSDNTGWTVERRFMPLRLPVMDRRLLEIAFRLPVLMKAGGSFFDRAASRILGPGSRIPSANDGVRPGSGHVSRLAQRGVRKLQNSGRSLMGRMGSNLHVPHSWHDYRSYWSQSPEMAKLKEEYQPRLESFEGMVFSCNAKEMLTRDDLPWRTSYRFLQLAVWRALIDDYRL